jgi:two-component system sensor histidine kinase KdpD
MRIASEIAQVYDLRAVALFDKNHNTAYRAGPEDIERGDDFLRDVMNTGTEFHDTETETTIGPVRLGNQICGSLALRGPGLSDTALHALRNLTAISLESERSRELATLAEAERHSERFKSMLLDGLAHEFKTPLTSIKAASSALITDTVREPGPRRELLSIIDQESERLGKLVTEAIHLSRIEADKVHLNRTPHSIAGLVQSTLKGMETALDGRRVDLELACPELTTAMDFDLMQLALRQLIDNAAKYSPRRSSIRIRAEKTNGTIHIGVHSLGDPLPEKEQERIFDRFYRGSSIRHTVAGTGLGLAVAREILRAHGGDISVESSNEAGTEFTMVFPMRKAVEEPCL